LLPLHVWPAQVCPDQVWPDQVCPLQHASLQVCADQVWPDQVWPDQVCAYSGVADQAVGLHGLPMMSRSPVSSAPVVASATCEVPRDFSTEPVPVDRGKF